MIPEAANAHTSCLPADRFPHDLRGYRIIPLSHSRHYSIIRCSRTTRDAKYSFREIHQIVIHVKRHENILIKNCRGNRNTLSRPFVAICNPASISGARQINRRNPNDAIREKLKNFDTVNR